MSQELSSWEIQTKQQLIYSLDREITRNEIANNSLRFKIEITQDEIKELKKQEGRMVN